MAKLKYATYAIFLLAQNETLLDDPRTYVLGQVVAGKEQRKE